MKICGHHRQRLEDGTVLPCAHPRCIEGAFEQRQLMIQLSTGDWRHFERFEVPPKRASYLADRWVWREAVAN